MLDEIINTTLIEQTLQDKDATQLELELTYRLRDALDEIDRLCQDVCQLEAQAVVQRGGYPNGPDT